MRNIILAAALLAMPVEAAVQHATGTFEVKMTPGPTTTVDGVAIGRHALAKTFAGDMTATSSGEMQTATGPVPTSAAYVFIERVAATIGGRSGGFVLAHLGTIDRDVPEQRVVIVPDSGTGGLAGIKGGMTIRMEGGKHYYDLAYEIAPR